MWRQKLKSVHNAKNLIWNLIYFHSWSHKFYFKDLINGRPIELETTLQEIFSVKVSIVRYETFPTSVVYAIGVGFIGK